MTTLVSRPMTLSLSRVDVGFSLVVSQKGVQKFTVVDQRDESMLISSWTGLDQPTTTVKNHLVK